MRFEQTPAPHAPPLVSVPVVMRRVLFALVPAALCYTWFFGYGLLINFVLVAVGAVLTEATVLRLRGRGTRRALRDDSALVTAALLSFALPPLVPAWIPLLGGGIAILLAKQLYGGLGKNLFNPAMVGYVVLLISFPVEMTQWVPPQMGDIDYHGLSLFEQLGYTFLGHLPAGVDVDALTRATPLDIVKEGVRAGRSFIEIRGGALFGDFGGRGWEWVANLIFLGGLYLLYTGVIRWHIPVAMLAGLLVPAGVVLVHRSRALRVSGLPSLQWRQHARRLLHRHRSRVGGRHGARPFHLRRRYRAPDVRAAHVGQLPRRSRVRRAC